MIISCIVLCAGTHTLFLVHGSNLIRSDLALRYRISPADSQFCRAAVCISPGLLEEWNVKYLVEEKVRQPFLHVLSCPFIQNLGSAIQPCFLGSSSQTLGLLAGP